MLTSGFLLVLYAAASPLDVHLPRDAGVTLGAFAGGFAFSLLTVDVEARWDEELLPFDEAVKRNFSRRAAAVSDALITTTIAMPLVAQLGRERRVLQDGAMVYAQALGLTYAFNSAAKYLVQRPRPYTYNDHASVRGYIDEQGPDSRLSFYSGHAATSFAAAVSGSYLFALGEPDAGRRAAMWGLELGLAAATAGLRVRAGKHFYSDVLTGALAGILVGTLVPVLHTRDRDRYRPEAREWFAMSAGLALGAAASATLPLPTELPTITLAPLPDGLTLTLNWGQAPFT